MWQAENENYNNDVLLHFYYNITLEYHADNSQIEIQFCVRFYVSKIIANKDLKSL